MQLGKPTLNFYGGQNFNGEKYLSIEQQCKVATIEDIGQVINDETHKESQSY